MKLLRIIGNLIGSRLTKLFGSEVISSPVIPTGLTAVWVDDFARLTTNAIPDDIQIEWYSSENGGAYALITTTAEGIITTDDYTWQNQSMAFKCRQKKGDQYSDYCEPVTLVTPLVWKTNQSTQTQVIINSMVVTAGKTVVVDWGDGTTENLTGTVTSKTHDYATPANPYYIKLSGDVNWITSLSHYAQVKSYGSTSKWVMPSRICSVNASAIYMYGNGFTGNIFSRSTVFDGYTGNPIYLRMQNQALSGVPAFTTIPVGFQNFDISNNQFSGDLSGVTNLRTATADGYRYLMINQFTDIPRGEMKRCTNFRGDGNAVVTAKLDAWFAYLNTYFGTNTPVQNCTFNVSGAAMGIPTDGASNTDIVGIKDKFTAAGFTATITIRTS